MSLHIDTVSLFWANHILLLLFNAACGEAENTDFIVIIFTYSEWNPYTTTL
jgi:hypothetical protein